jgi:hypothetical protein
VQHTHFNAFDPVDEMLVYMSNLHSKRSYRIKGFDAQSLKKKENGLIFEKELFG